MRCARDLRNRGTDQVKLILIRHGKTQGNLSGRYIGCRTDEDLCREGIEGLTGREYPAADKVFSSPMRRCVQTAGILYPGMPVQVVDALRECDFGDFENKNYAELNGRADYQAWIDSDGEMPFPGGESRKEFSERCISAFRETVDGLEDGSYAFVVHGGTIMAIMEAFAKPQGSYYDFQARNGEGYILNSGGGYEKLP